MIILTLFSCNAGSNGGRFDERPNFYETNFEDTDAENGGPLIGEDGVFLMMGKSEISPKEEENSTDVNGLKRKLLCKKVDDFISYRKSKKISKVSKKRNDMREALCRVKEVKIEGSKSSTDVSPLSRTKAAIARVPSISRPARSRSINVVETNSLKRQQTEYVLRQESEARKIVDRYNKNEKMVPFNISKEDLKVLILSCDFLKYQIEFLTDGMKKELMEILTFKGLAGKVMEDAKKRHQEKLREDSSNIDLLEYSMDDQLTSYLIEEINKIDKIEA